MKRKREIFIDSTLFFYQYELIGIYHISSNIIIILKVIFSWKLKLHHLIFKKNLLRSLILDLWLIPEAHSFGIRSILLAW